MAEGKGSKRENRVLAIAIGVAVLTVAVYVGYLKIPRHLSGLCHDFWQAEQCEVMYQGESLEPTSMHFEGKELEGLIEELDSLSLYPISSGGFFDSSVTLEGYTEWHFYFRINGGTADQFIIVTDCGQVAIGNRVFETRVEDMEALLKGISAE